MSGSQEAARSAGTHVTQPKHPEFSTLESRLNSFVGWPIFRVGVTAQALSECGFFYIGSADRVRCFHCGVTIRAWEPESDPFSEHVKWSPDCALVTELVPRAGGEAGSDDVQAPGGDIGGDVSSARSENRALDVERHRVTVNEAAGDLTVNTSPGGSQRTKTNTSESAQTPSHSATSHSYATRAAPTATSSSPAETRCMSVCSEQEQTPTVQAVLDMGYSPDVVNRIREAKRQRDGADFTDAVSLLGAILDDEKQTAMSDSASGSHPSSTLTATQSGLGSTMSRQSRHPPPVLPSVQAISTASSRMSSSLSDNASSHPSHSSGDTSAQPQAPSAGASAQPDPPEASASAQPRLLRTTRPGQCQLCGQAEISMTFLPCGHFISCQSCAPKCSTCPKCNRTILGTVKTYFA